MGKNSSVVGNPAHDNYIVYSSKCTLKSAFNDTNISGKISASITCSCN
jgi:hypothetical protein